MDKILSDRIFGTVYWKKHCFNINEADVCELAAELEFVGGMANNRPLPFICLVQKLVLLKPDPEVVEELLKQPRQKYLTAVTAFYVRLVLAPLDVYRLLEPLLADWRKLRLDADTLTTVDSLVDDLLTQQRVFGVQLPRLPPRPKLEDQGLELREDFLGEGESGRAS